MEFNVRCERRSSPRRKPRRSKAKQFWVNSPASRSCNYAASLHSPHIAGSSDPRASQNKEQRPHPVAPCCLSRSRRRRSNQLIVSIPQRELGDDRQGWMRLRQAPPDPAQSECRTHRLRGNHELVGQQRPLQAGRHLDKKGVARRVPEAVVDILASVQIEQDEPEPLAAFRQGAQRFVEGAPVRQTRQRVLKRPLVCLMLQLDMANHRLIHNTHVGPENLDQQRRRRAEQQVR